MKTEEKKQSGVSAARLRKELMKELGKSSDSATIDVERGDEEEEKRNAVTRIPAGFAELLLGAGIVTALLRSDNWPTSVWARCELEYDS